MREETRKILCQMAEKEYQTFSSALVPGEENILGVRLPKLRQFAKKIAKGDWENELSGEDVYFEETMLRGMILSYVTLEMEPKQAMEWIKEFIPKVKNWSICDSVFMKMDILKKDRELTWEFILPYMKSGDEFQVRVALIIMMQHLMKCDINGNKISRVRHITMEDLKSNKEKKRAGKYLLHIFEYIDRPFSEGYYAYMAAAWLVAECFCCFPAMTLDYLKESRMDDRTYNKGLQKITESLIPEKEVKQYIRSLKR